MALFILKCVFFCAFVTFVRGKAIQTETFNLTILHMNDVHAHFDEINVNSGRCHQDQAEREECFGGMGRMFTAIKSIQDQNKDETLLLNAGDYFQGTMWFSKLKYDPVVKFGNLLNWTAMGLGNHDFDLGAEDLADFSNAVNFDLLACNLVKKKTNLKPIKYMPSKVVNVLGRQIGIIGYVTTDTPNITAPNLPNLLFLDEIESVRKEARRLKSLNPPVDILIALGHAGYLKDLRMAEEVEEIDIVVGGHSHSFLYSGTPSEYMIEEVEGEFPTFVTQKNGRVVPVVQVYKYSKYLGHLKLSFDEQGELLDPVDGAGVSKADVLLIDSRFSKDSWVEEELDVYRQNLKEFYDKVGESNVLLAKIKNEESNIGNIITDSMIQYSKWNDTTIAFINNGGIRGTIDPGNITGEDIIQVLPFGNTIDRVTMYGRSIKGIFEEYAKGLCPAQICEPPTFLQISGLSVVYDVYSNKTIERVTSIKEKCGSNWCDLDMDKLYPVALQSFLARGGSYLYSFPDWYESHQVGDEDYPAFKQYIAEHSPINMSTEGRITINYHMESGAANVVVLPVVMLVLLLNTFYFF